MIDEMPVVTGQVFGVDGGGGGRGGGGGLFQEKGGRYRVNQIMDC